MENFSFKKTMQLAILIQCTGMIAHVSFENGFMISYLSKLGISSANILLYLSLPSLITFFLLLPCAYISDAYGKKRIGKIGLIGTVTGFLILGVIGSGVGKTTPLLIFAGICVFSIGFAMFISGWFALLDPLLPNRFRGRFFGSLRLSWHIAGIIFSFIITAILSITTTLIVYQSIMFVVMGLLIIRLILYLQIPEIEKRISPSPNFKKSFRVVLGIPGYMPFCAYTFFVMLFTGSCPWIFNLIEKDVLFFSEYQIVLMGNLLYFGSIVGFFFSGKIIDTYGTKTIFLVCHLSFGIILFLFVIRNIIPISPLILAGVLTVLFGLIRASSGIAITTEMMSLIPSENKSLSTSFNFMLYSGGITMSGIMAGKIIEFNILNKTWMFYGVQMTEYDTLLLGSGIMIILSVITLGLIPSVIKKAQLTAQCIPHGIK